jgi:hypothetical protein
MKPLPLIIASDQFRPEAGMLDRLTRLSDILTRSGRYKPVCKTIEDIRREGVETSALVVIAPLPADVASMMPSTTDLLTPADLGPVQAHCPHPVIASIRPDRAATGSDIWLVGFGDHNSCLEEVLGKIAKEQPRSRVFIDAAEEVIPDLRIRLGEADRWISFPPMMDVDVVTLSTGADVMDALTGAGIVIFNNDPRHSEYLQNLACLALGSASAVAFSKFATFPIFAGLETYIEDISLPALIEAGAEAQADLQAAFGEIALLARIDRSLLGVVTDSPQKGSDGITARHILALRGHDFIQSVYRNILGREADPEGLAVHLNNLAKGAHRAEILATVSLSPEGQAYGADIVGLPGVIRSYRRSRSFLGRAKRRLGIDPFPGVYARRSLRVMENQVARALDNEISSDIVRPLQPQNLSEAPPVPAERLDKPAKLLLAGATDDVTPRTALALAKLERVFTQQGMISRIIMWDRQSRKFRLAFQEELNRFGLGKQMAARFADYPAIKDPTRHFDHASCRAGDWLIVPDVIRPVGDTKSLVEMDVVMEAKRLDIRSCFLFHDCTPLQSKAMQGRPAEIYEYYIQALLLADVIIAGSKSAHRDLNDLFVHRQLAESIPFVGTLALPSNSRSGDILLWLDYARQLNGLFEEYSRNLGTLKRISIWSDSDASPKHIERRAKLIEAFAACGIKAVQSSPESEYSAVSPPDGISADWLLIPDIKTSDLAEIADRSKRYGFRVAAIVHDIEAIEADDQSLDILMGFDKIFAASQSTYSGLYRLMLNSRTKMHSTEHKVRCIAAPFDFPISRRIFPAEPSAIVHGIIYLSGQVEYDSVAVSAVEQALVLAGGKIRFTLAGEHSAAGSHSTAHAIEISKAVEFNGSESFVAFVAPSARCNSIIEEARWRGLPCLLPSAENEPNTITPGIALTDTADSAAFAEALARFTDRSWLNALSEEALAYPARPWANYARDLAVDLASDRLTDLLHQPQTQAESNPLERFPNLRRRPKLSLCISTFNRGRWVALSLRNIFSQIPEARDDLEILVVDNTSTDGTPELMAPFFDRSDFRFVRNLRNVGMLGNLAVTAHHARGEYIWILGDDDLVRPGVIERILGILLEKPELSLVYMNYGYSTEGNPDNVTLPDFLENYNILQPSSEDYQADVKEMAANTENFYTAIWSHIYRRDHALKSYCQNTSGRIFSTMLSCIPTTHYVLNYMSDLPSYWLGQPALVVNSNVSWVPYAPLFELEHFPNGWDIAERMGCDPSRVDKRRADRLWMVEKMWTQLFEDDAVGNGAYVLAPRIILRLKHLPQIDQYVPRMKAVYQQAYEQGHQAATMPPDTLFAAWS